MVRLNFFVPESWVEAMNAQTRPVFRNLSDVAREALYTGLVERGVLPADRQNLKGARKESEADTRNN